MSESMSNQENNAVKFKKPLIVSFGDYTNGEYNFINYWGEVSFEVDESLYRKIKEFCFKCNGLSTVNEIANELPHIQSSEIFAIANFLFDNKIICDSREFYKIFHKASQSPPRYTYNFFSDQINLFKNSSRSFKFASGEIFPLKNLSFIPLVTSPILKRRSVRNFSGEALLDQELSDILILAYSTKTHKSTPSGGGFYPLRVYFLLRKETESYSPGLYFYNHTQSSIHKISDLDNLLDTRFNVALGSAVYSNAALVVFVSCELKLVANKYANRSYRMALLEAGHLCQNVYVTLSESRLGVVEYGGWNDEVVANLLKLDTSDSPVLTVLMVGCRSEDTARIEEPFEREDEFLRSKISLPESVVKNLETELFQRDDYMMPGYASVARYIRYSNIKDENPKLYSAFGFGKSIYESRVKAVAEALERHLAGRIRVDRVAVPKDLKGSFFSILNDSRQQKVYLELNNLSPLDEANPCSLVKGVAILDESQIFWVPVDQVFYPIKTEGLMHKVSFFANSTGVAAHTERSIAIKKALLELVERDAVAVVWYSKKAPRRIERATLPESVRLRVSALEKIGRMVEFFDITTDSVPVVLCICFGDSFPMTTSGCSASENSEEAAKKSLDEAEFIFNSWMNADRGKKEYSQIRSATDHGDLLAWIRADQDENIKWIFSGFTGPLPASKEGAYLGLLTKHNPVVVDLSSGSDCLFVVRVLSKTLYPFTFGYGSEFYRHHRFSLLGLEWGWDYPAFPHLIA